MNGYAKLCAVCCVLGNVFGIGQLYTPDGLFTALCRFLMASSVLGACYLLWKSEQVKTQY